MLKVVFDNRKLIKFVVTYHMNLNVVDYAAF